MFIINPSGNVVGINEKSGQELLQKQGFRKALPHEVPLQFQPPKPESETIAWFSNAITKDGYGEATRSLQAEFMLSGMRICNRDNEREVGFAFYIPPIMRHVHTKRKILYTMFESTSIPKSWENDIRLVDQLVVPSPFCQKSFETRGCKSIVVPLGYNYHDWELLERENDRPFTFIHYDAFNTRKGFDLVFEAFREEFGDDENVKMIFKTVNGRLPFPIMTSEYPNIEVVKQTLSIEDFKALLQRCDCLVFPSRGEGMGLPPLESLATGIPSIITIGSGMEQYYDSSYFYGVKVSGKTTPIYRHYNIAELGHMEEPDFDQLKKQMRKAYKNKDETRQMGIEGSKWVRENWAVDKTIEGLKEVIADQRAKLTKRKSKVDVSVVSIALNESKYMEVWLKNHLKREEIKEIVIVEGAVSLYRRKTPSGLSIDNMGEIIESIMNSYDCYKYEKAGSRQIWNVGDKRIVYYKYGIAENKDELLNASIRECKRQGWYLVSPTDEIFTDENWEKLVDIMSEGEACIYFKFNHFWKSLDRVAVGGQWDKYMFRCYKYRPSVESKIHGDDFWVGKKKINEIMPVKILEDVFVNHYSYVKDPEDIEAKLYFYKLRDVNLKVKDNWTSWRPGVPTSPTHGNGTYKKYKGEHPEFINAI